MPKKAEGIEEEPKKDKKKNGIDCPLCGAKGTGASCPQCLNNL